MPRERRLDVLNTRNAVATQGVLGDLKVLNVT